MTMIRRLGPTYRNSGIKATVPSHNGQGTIDIRLSDVAWLASRGLAVGSRSYNDLVENIAKARTGDLAAQQCLNSLSAAGTGQNGFKVYGREDLERIDREVLAGKASKCVGGGNRLRKEASDPNRTAYYRDLGRIVHSRAFRALSGKTQVFPFPKNPYVHTRAFHSIKVAQLGESIGKSLGLNIDLIWAIGLGHDLGHSPFGHGGETALDAISRRELGADQPFRHNVQSMRVLMELEEYWPQRTGMNITLEVLDGILHHWGESNEYAITPREEPAYRKYLNMIGDLGQLDLFEAEQGPDDPASILSKAEIEKMLDPARDKEPPLTYEACVIRLADKIAYLPVDLEDALAYGFLVEKKLPTAERKRMNQIRRVLGQAPTDMFNTMVSDTIRTSRATGMIAMSQAVGEAMNALKQFVYDNICFSADRREVDGKVPFIFDQIFAYLTQIENFSAQEAIDKIASMTDRQASKLFQKITVPKSII